MNTHTAILSTAIAVIITLLLSGAWMVLAAEPTTARVTTGPPVVQTNPSHYQSLTERLQKQWRVDPLIADAHNLSPTGWETPACAPRPGLRQTSSGSGTDSTEQCVKKCMKGTWLENPNGILLCRNSCL